MSLGRGGKLVQPWGSEYPGNEIFFSVTRSRRKLYMVLYDITVFIFMGFGGAKMCVEMGSFKVVIWADKASQKGRGGGGANFGGEWDYYYVILIF